MNEEQLYKASFDELSITLLDVLKNNAMLKAQAEHYLSLTNSLKEENELLKAENEELHKQINKPDISDVINKTTEENK